uniref:Uncharacterized protein n=1 Tax=Romanomermis culicivorax TaxID=13658 RepID=A0A915LAL3_ROMCU
MTESPLQSENVEKETRAMKINEKCLAREDARLGVRCSNLQHNLSGLTISGLIFLCQYRDVKSRDSAIELLRAMSLVRLVDYHTMHFDVKQRHSEELLMSPLISKTSI